MEYYTRIYNNKNEKFAVYYKRDLHLRFVRS